MNTTDIQQNDTIEAYPNFTIRDFHVFGIDWYKKRVVYWVENEEGKKQILWEQFEKLPFLTMRMYGYLWWSNWLVVPEHPDATEKPNFSPQLIFDWMRYDPLEEGLDDYGYPKKEEGGEEEEQDKTPNNNNLVAIIVPIVVVAVVIIVVIVSILIIRAKKKQNEEESAEINA